MRECATKKEWKVVWDWITFVEGPIRKLRQWGPLGLKPILCMELIIRWVMMNCILRSWLKPQPYQQLMVFIQVLPWLGSSCCRSLVTTLPRNYAVSSWESVSPNLIILAFSFSKVRIGIYILSKIRRLYTPDIHTLTNLVPRAFISRGKGEKP